uniref:Uncharacterized protein n=1 Tax=Oryza rufipogon TaxID=4529 RepID=A0A0E0RCT6_ORYRU
MAAEICLSKLPQLIADPNAEFQTGLCNTGSQQLNLREMHREADHHHRLLATLARHRRLAAAATLFSSTLRTARALNSLLAAICSSPALGNASTPHRKAFLPQVPAGAFWGKEALEEGGSLKVAAIGRPHRVFFNPTITIACKFHALQQKEASKEEGPLNNVVEDMPRKREEKNMELDKRKVVDGGILQMEFQQLR